MSEQFVVAKEMPLVSVCIVTYNHASYIGECIEGALNQQVDFPYEICIGEDESSDGTREICKDYAERYSHLIRLFQRSRKDVIYSHGYPTGRFNFIQTIKACRGKYVALCEGDDYWHNLNKLQKQVEFMELHSEYSMCNSDYDYQNEISGYSIKNYWRTTHHKHDEEENIAPLSLSEQYIIRTPTVMMRRDYLISIFEEYANDFDERFRLADSQMWFHLSRMGKVKYFDESMATYRRVPNSVTAVNNLNNRFDFIKNVYWHKRTFAERSGYDDILPRIDRSYLTQLANLAVLTQSWREARDYADKLKREHLWPSNKRLLRMAATYGGIFALFYRWLISTLLWCDRYSGNLGGHLRVALNRMKKLRR